MSESYEMAILYKFINDYKYEVLTSYAMKWALSRKSMELSYHGWIVAGVEGGQGKEHV